MRVHSKASSSPVSTWPSGLTKRSMYPESGVWATALARVIFQGFYIKYSSMSEVCAPRYLAGPVSTQGWLRSRHSCQHL